ncbi:NUDIX hydrolase [Pseudonocardia acaciae]|uniref:NUDIX hydrolase n=1 Tax=Pseudonocardia acaciae TaxID=551276 RepID=UPI0007E8D4CF|nr:NUDIX domain-containing protein [Pseudonocardia acaciae]
MPEHAEQDFVFDTRHDRYPVAVHVILTDETGRVLLMRRAGSGYADGRLALPAGHVDLGETPTACARREIAEELGIQLDPTRLQPSGVMFRRSLEPRVDIFFSTSTWGGTPIIREPHKCTELVWSDRHELPADTMDFVGAAITNASTGRHYDEHGWQAAGQPCAPSSTAAPEAALLPAEAGDTVR